LLTVSAFQVNLPFNLTEFIAKLPGASRVPKAALAITKEAARHVLRHPVLAVVAVATTHDGRTLLIRRRDTGAWALPGGTLEWGETLRACIARELLEEAGARVVSLGQLQGVYSAPERDYRFHGVTVVVRALVEEPHTRPKNPLEIAEVRLFRKGELPEELSLGQRDMLSHALTGTLVWE
jgi:8-oxo-dGTP diphosphatase